MKLNKNLKRNIIVILTLMYVSGFSIWLLKNFFQIDNGMGPEPRTQQIWFLRFHGTMSFAVVMLLGYVLRAHVLPYWRMHRGLKSGLPLLGHFFLILFTVPFVLYLTDENLKSLFEQIHAYLGLFLIVPFAIHLIAKTVRFKSGKT